jgi:hypothetical protein
MQSSGAGDYAPRADQKVSRSVFIKCAREHHLMNVSPTYRSRLQVATLLVLATLLTACGINNIPTLDEQAKAAWGQVQNQYQRRADLIPNLVETVKGYAKHEEAP